jgi:hypothetical protein
MDLLGIEKDEAVGLSHVSVNNQRPNKGGQFFHDTGNAAVFLKGINIYNGI